MIDPSKQFASLVNYRLSGEASVSKCCLLFASKGVGIGAIRFGVSVVVGVEQAVLQN